MYIGTYYFIKGKVPFNRSEKVFIPAPEIYTFDEVKDYVEI